MKIYVINLERNPERLAFIQAQLGALGLGFERVEACDGRALTAEEKARQFSRVRSFIAMKKKMSAAEIGCAISHTRVYRKMIEDGVDAALILEDDVRLEDGFVKALERVEKFLEAGKAQAFVLSGYGIEGGEKCPEEIRRENSIWCADAYCVTRGAAEIILKANWPVRTVADSFKRWRKFFGLELYRVLPTTVKQDDAQFKSENQVLPKSNWLVRNLMWVVDWVLIKVFHS